MDYGEMDVGIQNSEDKKVVNADMKTETKTGNEIRLHESVSLLNAFTHAISGKENVSETPETNPKDLVGKMREIVFRTFEENETENQGKTHLQMLAEKQDKQLKDLPDLPLVAEERTAKDELDFLTVLVSNIHEVQNGSSLGITPNMSLELNCMDCSMSTWVLVHEAKKKNINIEFGSPIGHAIGIVTLSDGRTFYADGQKGFVEEIKVTEREVGTSKVLEIENYREIQDRMVDNKGEKEFFPQYVFVDSQGGVSATMSNLDSMLYKQFTGEITDEIRKKYNPGYIREVEVLKPFAIDFQKDAQSIGQNKVESTMLSESVNLTPEDEIKFKKMRMEEIKITISQDLTTFRECEEYKADSKRLNGPKTSY